MTSADRNRVAINRNATTAARRPAIVTQGITDVAIKRALEAIKEHLEVMQGARRNPWEKVVTQRDLEDMGIAQLVTASSSAPAGTVMVKFDNGSFGYLSFEDFANKITATKLFRDLNKRLNDDSRFDDLPDEVKAILLADLNEIALARGAAVQRIEQIVQDANQSLALTVTEITASFNGNTAGVRELAFAAANDVRATAGTVTQVVAGLETITGEAGVEAVMLALADVFTGLLAQYTLKVNAGGAFAAIGLSATENTAGVSDSHIIFVANNFAFVHPDDVIGTGPGEVDPTNPGASRIPFGIDGDGIIYLNGQVRINALGQTLDDLAAATGIYISTTSGYWKVDSTGTAVNTTITLTANFTDGLSGFVDWSKSGTGTAPPTAGTTNTWTINAADQVDDAVTYTASFVDGLVTYTDSLTVVRLRDGTSALTGLLTNEAHTVPASSAGVISSFTGAGGTFKVYQGITDITTSCTFAIQSNPSTLTASIGAATGIFSVTAVGSWADASNTTTLTLRATYGSTTIDKVFTLTKAVGGAAGVGTPGANGARGSVTGFGSAYGISTNSWGTGATAPDRQANAVISNILNGTSLTTLSTTAHLVIGDQVTLSNGTSFAALKYWSGSAWVSPGVVIDGNLLVNGTVSANVLNGGSITGSSVNLGSGAFQVTTAGVVTSSNFTGLNSNFGSLSNPANPALTASSNNFSANAQIYGVVNAGTTSLLAHAIRGTNNVVGRVCSGLVGASNGKAFHAESGTAGPFTGSHDVAVPNGVTLTPGTIVVDDGCLLRNGWSNTLFRARASTTANQKGAIGVYTGDLGHLNRYALLSACADLVVSESGDVSGPSEFEAIKNQYRVGEVNGLGEGQMLVNGQGGNLESGDPIATSSMAGVGMRQLKDGEPDDVMRAYTVAKSRENVTFSHPAEVKTVAVFYVAGG